MPRTPAKSAKRSAPAKKAPAVRNASPVKRAARRVAADAEQVRVDVDQLPKSLDHLGVVALRRVVARATVLIAEKTEGERRSLIDEVTARAKGLGLSLADLVGKAVPESVRPVALGGKPAKAVPAKKETGKRASPAVKFRGPNGEEWSGRGRAAKWLVVLEATGRKREEFAV